jgi:hypothetical protein
MNWLLVGFAVLWVGLFLTIIGWTLAALKLAARADRMAAECWAATETGTPNDEEGRPR